MEPILNLKANELVKSMKIFHLAMVISASAFTLFSFLLIANHGPFAQLDKANIQILLTGGLLACVVLISSAYLFHSWKTKKITKMIFLSKLYKYRSSLLLKICLQEAALLLLLVIYVLTASVSMLLTSIILIILLLLNQPGVDLISSELKLDENETSQLRSAD